MKKTLKIAAAALLVSVLIGSSYLRLPVPVVAAGQLEPNWTFDDVVEQMHRDWIGGTVKKEEMTGQVREFNMHIEEIEHELTDGVKIKAWAYGLEGQPATVPGPQIRVKKGDLVRIVIKNNSTQPHSLHPHGITSVDMLNDGVAHITGNYIMPKKSYTYEFVAKEAGTHWYHCHVQTSLHQDMGMYGSLIIEDTEKPSWDKEFTMMLDEWDTHRDPSNATAKPTYNYYSVNGKSGNSIPDMMIKEGEIARVRLINAGFESHSEHLHGTHFVVIAKDGYKVPQPYNMDTVNIAPGETYDVLVKGRDGVWPWHDHNSLAATDDGVYPGGMLMHIRGSGDDKFNPEANPSLMPVEGHIHASDDHVLTTNGDPLFIKEKMTYNSEEWLSASPERRAKIHDQNMEWGQSIGGVYNAVSGTWSFPSNGSTIIQQPSESPNGAHPNHQHKM
ncbi:FtsP/CotA-like multicopper oxidase with cupredoxin domain [Paenibacillus sp. V4I3]|uniref:multicopper oxidase family protein n=1 Tax=Paenibacillus sp. V4I3 TaxID=3042305 RepID=UPI00278075E3|nr:multicopper oxidase domain-containing protein [Paenibacillus sp. V4I3]MDQ0874397.1 FtsP/CotA-like multicopper oxidase with cupredoxin domain [Paenibacillus sp. V4I3]